MHLCRAGRVSRFGQFRRFGRDASCLVLEVTVIVASCDLPFRTINDRLAASFSQVFSLLGSSFPSIVSLCQAIPLLKAHRCPDRSFHTKLDIRITKICSKAVLSTRKFNGATEDAPRQNLKHMGPGHGLP